MNWDTFVCIDCPHVYYTETNPLRHAEILKPNLPLNWTITWYIFCLNNRIYLTWSFRDHRKNRRKVVHIFLFDNFDLKSKPKSRTMIISSPIMHELSMSNCPMYWHIARVPICCFMHRIFMSYDCTSKTFDIFASLSVSKIPVI